MAKVLLIQQDVPLREQYRDLLDYNGFDVYMVDEPEQGIFLAAQQQPDVVVLDFKLAGASGVVIAERLASVPATANIPLICMITSDHNLEMLLHPVAREVLSKPVDPTALMSSIWRVLGGSHESA